MASKWLDLEQHGQSIWYDNVARPALESGLLERLMAEDGVSGGTSNPSIFAAAVTGSDHYDDDIRNAGADESVQQVFERCAVADIQRACDLMRPVWERTNGDDGYISLEVEADLAFEEDATVQRAHRLRALVDRPNVMIKVPGTAEGVEAFRRLTRDGVSVNVTLLFSTERYREIAEAYVDGIEGRVDAGEPVGDIASVASFFVSRIDTKVDKLLPGGLAAARPRGGRQREAGLRRRLRAGPPRARAGTAWRRPARARSDRCGPRPARRTPRTRRRCTSTR